jgi:NAD(P)H-quinone oxidoreductase subunit 5
MPDIEQVLFALGMLVVVSPLVMTVLLGVSTLINRKLSEEATTSLGHVTIACGLLASIAILGIMLAVGTRHIVVELGDWVVIPHHYHFSVKFVFDRLSVPFAILSFVLSGTIGAFASQYMHREPGFNRFFVLYAIFVLGMIVTALAGTIETLFTGWELVGLSSALLVAFYQERPAPPRNGLWIWVVYRVSDASLLLAAVVMHHLRGEEISTSCSAAAPGPTSIRRSSRSKRFWWGGSCSSRLLANRGSSPFPAGCPDRWKGRPPPAPYFTGPSRFIWERFCSCASVPCSICRSGFP